MVNCMHTNEEASFQTHNYYTIAEGDLFRVYSKLVRPDISKGGLIEKESNLDGQVGSSCWISEGVTVTGNARVEGNAQVRGKVKISGDAIICGDVEIDDEVEISGNVKVRGNSLLYGNVKIRGNTIIEKNESYNSGIIDRDDVDDTIKLTLKTNDKSPKIKKPILSKRLMTIGRRVTCPHEGYGDGVISYIYKLGKRNGLLEVKFDSRLLATMCKWVDVGEEKMKPRKPAKRSSHMREISIHTVHDDTKRYISLI